MIQQGKTLQASALASGMSERTARTWKEGLLPSHQESQRHWRTREDPFALVWEDQVLPMLRSADGEDLQAQTILAQIKWPQGHVKSRGSVRTMQRRIAQWRAMEGGEKEVYFQQDKRPGEIGGFDFTCCNELSVTIRGEHFKHLFFEFVLLFSCWRSIMLAFSETYEALTLGLQNAFWKVMGRPPPFLRRQKM